MSSPCQSSSHRKLAVAVLDVAVSVDVERFAVAHGSVIEPRLVLLLVVGVVAPVAVVVEVPPIVPVRVGIGVLIVLFTQTAACREESTFVV